MQGENAQKSCSFNEHNMKTYFCTWGLNPLKVIAKACGMNGVLNAPEVREMFHIKTSNISHVRFLLCELKCVSTNCN